MSSTPTTTDQTAGGTPMQGIHKSPWSTPQVIEYNHGWNSLHRRSAPSQLDARTQQQFNSCTVPGDNLPMMDPPEEDEEEHEEITSIAGMAFLPISPCSTPPGPIHPQEPKQGVNTGHQTAETHSVPAHESPTAQQTPCRSSA